MLYAVQLHWIRTTLCFILASFFRSNGVLLAGYLVWGLVVQPFLDGKQLSFFKIAYCITLSACVTAPFTYHNYSAYCLFCNIPNKPQWCYRIPPSIYTHVQAKYWDVGFLRYWTPSQIRNFVIAAPPLVLLITFSVQHIKLSFLGFRIRLNSVKETNKEENPFAMPSITPKYSLVMCTTLIFFSHTQIVLCLAAALPTLYWAAAWLFVYGSPWGQILEIVERTLGANQPRPLDSIPTAYLVPKHNHYFITTHSS
ncbi:GPI mannosyltransferase 2 [Termitomyces sp. T112]|nr:GPI mannosyltransferase 2 [Termitomyces sp. T112]